MSKLFYLLLLIFLVIVTVRFMKHIKIAKTKNLKQVIQEQDLAKSPFVKAKNTVLYVDGKIFKSVGVNRYNLLSYDQDKHCASSFTEDEIDVLFSELKKIGATSIRFWLFQSFTDAGNDLERFDYVINKARENNIFIIPVLENHWADCTEGGVKDEEWYESGYQSPYDDYSISLTDYIKKVVPLYKDERVILAWQIMNEAEGEDEEDLYNFAKETSELIKSLDKNHLVSIGLMRNNRTAGYYRKLHSLKTIDVLDFHDYNNPNTEIPKELENSFKDARALKKPLIIAEAGTYWEENEDIKPIEEKIKAYFDKGGNVYMLWSYGDSSVTDDGHNFDINSSLVPIIKSITSSLK